MPSDTTIAHYYTIEIKGLPGQVQYHRPVHATGGLSREQPGVHAERVLKFFHFVTGEFLPKSFWVPNVLKIFEHHPKRQKHI